MPALAAGLLAFAVLAFAAPQAALAQQSADATLSALAVTDGDGNPLPLDPPAFASDTTDYAVRVGFDATSVKVTATVNESNATLAGSLSKDGGTAEAVTMTSGTAVELSDLAAGANVLTITVTAQNSAEQTYTLKVDREALELLSALAVTSDSGAALTLNPPFPFGLTDYTPGSTVTTRYHATVDHEVTSVMATATVAGEATTLAYTFQKAGDVASTSMPMTSGMALTLSDLGVGANVLEITATAADDTTRIYRVTVTRRTARSSDATLSSIVMTNGDSTAPSLLILSPAFSPAVTTYTTTVGNAATSPTISPVTSHPAATLSVSLEKDGGSPEPVTVANDSAVLSDLAVGDNVVRVAVTAPEDAAQQTYTVTVTRLAATGTAPPAASIEPSAAQRIGEGVDLTLVGSGSDPDGGTVTVGWTAENSTGTDVTSDVFTGATNGGTATFNASTPGAYTVTLTVTDDESETASATLAVTVTDGLSVRIDQIGAARIPRDGTLEFSAMANSPDGGTIGYEWSARDSNDSVVTSDVLGSTTNAATVGFSASTPGVYTVQVSASVTVNSETFVASDTVTVLVTGNSATLSALALTDRYGAVQPLNRPFSSAKTEYAATVDHAVTSAGVTASVEHEGATLSATLARAGGTAEAVSMRSGSTALLSNLAVGDNVLTITVRAEDSSVTTTYTVTVTRQEDTTLRRLVVTDGDDVRQVLTPGFSSAATAYTVANAFDTAKVTATVSDSAATLSASLTTAAGVPRDVTMTSGSAATLSGLAEGDNVLTITVMAPGGATRDYTLTLTRTAAQDPTVSIEPSGDQTVRSGANLVLRAMASDPDGGGVSHAWTALDASGADATSSVFPGGPNAATVTFVASTPGAHIVTLAVTDDENATAVATVTVTVLASDSGMRRTALKRVLGVAGMQMLSGALDNLGARLGDAGSGTSLALAGQAVSPGGAGPVAGVSDLTCRPDVAGRRGIDAGVAGAGGGECGLESRSVTVSELLGSSAFSLALGASEGATTRPGGLRWALWGRGDEGSFAGNSEGVYYDGEMNTLWLGMDVRAGSWVAGLAASRGESETSYGFDSNNEETGTGHLETTLTALYPYGRWTFADGLEARGILGAGTGEARHRPDEGARDRMQQTSALRMWMASVGARQALQPLAGFELTAQGDLGWVRMETGEGPDDIDDLNADGWRARAGLEASRRVALDERASLEPFMEAAGRYDGGDGLNGTGLEVAGGVRYGDERLHVEARWRWLAAHSEAHTRERGLSVTARLGPDARGRGLLFALTPRWGAATGGADALWDDEMPRVAGGAALAGTAAPDEDTALDAALGYGFGVAPEVLVTPFVEAGVASGAENRRVRLGARYQASQALALEVSGERQENATADPGHALGLDVRVRF